MIPPIPVQSIAVFVILAAGVAGGDLCVSGSRKTSPAEHPRPPAFLVDQGTPTVAQPDGIPCGGDGSERPVPRRYSDADRPNDDSTTKLPT